MNARLKEIEALTAETARLESQVAAEFEAIGRSLPPPPDAVAGRDALERLRADIGRILELDNRRSALHASLESTERDLRRLVRDADALCEKIGRLAYETFCSMNENAEHRDLFAPVLRLDGEIAKHEDEIKRIDEESASHGFLRKLIRDKGRKVVTQGSIRRLEKSKEAAFIEVGDRVAASTFAERIKRACGEQLRDLAERHERMDLLLKDKAERAAEAGVIDRELETLGAGERPRDRIRELEGKVEETAHRLREVLVACGRAHLEENPGAGGTLAEALATLQTKRRRIDALKAESEMQEILDHQKTLHERRKELEEETRIRERQLHVIELELTMGARRMDQLKRVLSDGVPFTEPPPLPPTPDFYGPRR